MYSAFAIYFAAGVRYQGLRHSQRDTTFENKTLCDLLSLNPDLHCLALYYCLCLCARRPKHMLDSPPELGMS